MSGYRLTRLSLCAVEEVLAGLTIAGGTGILRALEDRYVGWMGNKGKRPKERLQAIVRSASGAKQGSRVAYCSVLFQETRARHRGY